MAVRTTVKATNPPNEKPNGIRPDQHPSPALPDGLGADVVLKPLDPLKNLSISIITTYERHIPKLSSACKV